MNGNGKHLLIFAALVFGIFVFGIGNVSAETITVCPIGCNSTSITEGVNLASAGDTVLVYPNGTSSYYEKNINITTPLTIEGASREDVILICSDGSTTCDVSHGNDGPIKINTAGNVTVRNMTIKNTWWGISLDAGSLGVYLVVEDITCFASYGDCADTMNGEIPGNTTTIIRDNNFTAYYPLYFWSMDPSNDTAVYVYNNILTGNVIAFGYIETVEITGNTLQEWGVGNLFQLRGSTIGSFQIKNNFFNYTDNRIHNGKTLQIKNNIFDTGWLDASDNEVIVIENNQASNFSDFYTQGQNITIKNNQMIYGYNGGPYITAIGTNPLGSYANIEGNKLITTADVIGCCAISVERFSGSVVSNYIKNNTITFLETPNPTIIKGIKIGQVSGGLIENNKLTKSGITIHNSTDLILIYNEIYDSYKPIYLDVATHKTMISLNNLFNYTLNAEDDGVNNSWDDGIVGNYWSNYTGEDANLDGIGDTPYNISGSAGAADNNPFMIPFGTYEADVFLNQRDITYNVSWNMQRIEDQLRTDQGNPSFILGNSLKDKVTRLTESILAQAKGWRGKIYDWIINN